MSEPTAARISMVMDLRAIIGGFGAVMILVAGVLSGDRLFRAGTTAPTIAAVLLVIPLFGLTFLAEYRARAAARLMLIWCLLSGSLVVLVVAGEIRSIGAAGFAVALILTYIAVVLLAALDLAAFVAVEERAVSRPNTHHPDRSPASKSLGTRVRRVRKRRLRRMLTGRRLKTWVPGSGRYHACPARCRTRRRTLRFARSHTMNPRADEWLVHVGVRCVLTVARRRGQAAADDPTERVAQRRAASYGHRGWRQA